MATLPHVKLTAFGTLGAVDPGVEIWSCGLKIAVAEAANLNVLVPASQADVNEISVRGQVAWANLITANSRLVGTAVNSLFNKEVRLTGVKAAAVLADGKDNPALQSTITDALPASRGKLVTNPPQPIPFSVALVATLRGSTFQRGAAAFGRIYLPLPNLTVSEANDNWANMVDGQIANPGVFAKAVARTLDSINSLVLTSGRKVMVANISTSEAAAGVRFQNVSRVICDNRPDTVRRRSNKLGGKNPITQTLPAPALA